MNDDNIVLSYPLMARQREDKIKSNLVAYAEDVNAELDHMVDVHNQLVMMLNGEWSEDTGRIYQLMNQAITTANEAKAIADNCVKRSGDTMTGHLNSSLTPTSDYNLVNKAYVDDKVNTEVGSVEARVELLEDFAENLEADQVKLDNTNFSSTNVHDGFSELFISVSNGKAIVAAAITGKGVETAADASFKTMADNINAILTFTEGTRGGTATNADIIYGKTAYARGQLLVGTLDLSTLHDTSDATATPYDILIGKVAYGNNGKIIGALNITDDGTINYDTAGVKKIYGYASDTLSVTTAYNSLGVNAAPSIGVNKNTGDPVFKIEFKSYINGIITFVTHVIDRNSDGSFNYVNEKETTLDITDVENYEELDKIYPMACTQVSDCSNLNEVYLHFIMSGVSDTNLFVCKMKRTYVEDVETGANIYYWEVDKAGGFWYKENISSYLSSTLSRIVISSIGDKAGKYGVCVSFGGSSSNTGIVTYKLGIGNIIDILTSDRLNGGNSWGIFTAYLGYNDRFLCISKGTMVTNEGGIIWLSTDFTVQNEKTPSNYFRLDQGIISPDGNLLIIDNDVYDFRNAIENATGAYPSISTELYDKLGELPRGGYIVSPSSNLFINYYASSSQSVSEGYRRYTASTIDINNPTDIVTKTQTYGSNLGIIGDNQQRFDYFSNDGSIYWNINIGGSSNNKREVILKFERDYSELIALEYEGDYYYKVGYTGGLIPGGES